MAPVLRSTALFKPVEDLSALKGRFETLKVFGAARGSRLRAFFLRKYADKFWWSQRSLRRGWGLPVREDELSAAGLLDRERFYLSLPSSADPPLPGVVSGYFKSSVPEGWVRVPGKSDDTEFYRELVALSWDPKRADELAVGLKEGTFTYVKRSPKIRRLLGLTNAAFRRYVAVPLPPFETRKHLVWVRKNEGGVLVAPRFVAGHG
jgi:hypothetical protein